MATEAIGLNRDGQAADAAGEDKVGYRKPPVAHQFKKGNRANPGGKRKVKPSEAVIPQLPSGTFNEMLLLEARREVRVKAGGRFVAMPVLQAGFRALSAKAAKGDQRSLIALAGMARQAEAEERAAQRRARPAPALDRSMARAPGSPMAAAEEYREVWTRVLSDAEERELEIAAPVPHPDDVAIGQVRGTVRWPGSRDGEMLSLDAMAAMHAELQDALPLRREAIEAMAEGREKAEAWCAWFAQADAFNLIELHLPVRYAGQIRPDEEPPEARLRDRSLRALAAHDRDRFAHEPAEDDDDNDGWWDEEDEEAEAEAAGEVVEEAADIPAPVEEIDAPVAPLAAALPEPPEVEPAREVSPEVAEAIVYRDAWQEALKGWGETRTAITWPVPDPWDVTIDTETMTITYREPPEPGQRATIANLRAGLAKLKVEARQYQGDVRGATNAHFADIAAGKRDDVLAMCAVIERWLEDG